MHLLNILIKPIQWTSVDILFFTELSYLCFGFASIILAGILCAYCSHILIKCSHVLCKRVKVPALDFGGIAATAFSTGPHGLRKLSSTARYIVDAYLIIYPISSCFTRIVYMAQDFREAIACFLEKYIWILLIPMILITSINNLKYLVILSLIGNCMLLAGLGIELYKHILVSWDVSAPSTFSWDRMATVFNRSLVAFPIVTVIMSLEKKMNHSTSLSGFPKASVPFFCMIFVFTMYENSRFYGYISQIYDSALKPLDEK